MSDPQPPRRPRSGSRTSQRQARRGLLHPLEDLLALSQRPAAAQENGSSAQRRQRQRLALAQRLLDPLPPGLVAPEAAADRFWTILRWGGLGLILARLLQR